MPARTMAQPSLSGISHRWMLSALCSVALLVPQARPEQHPDRVHIHGGADAGGLVYTWAIKNKDVSPIVSVMIPAAQAVFFKPPDGWSAAEAVDLETPGGRTISRAWVADAPSNHLGILQGTQAEFQAQLGPRGARRGRGEIIIRFADQTELAVPNVELPLPESRTERFASLIGLGLLFAVGVLIHWARGKSRKTARVE